MRFTLHTQKRIRKIIQYFDVICSIPIDIFFDSDSNDDDQRKPSTEILWLLILIVFFHIWVRRKNRSTEKSPHTMVSIFIKGQNQWVSKNQNILNIGFGGAPNFWSHFLESKNRNQQKLFCGTDKLKELQIEFEMEATTGIAGFRLNEMFKLILNQPCNKHATEIRLLKII